MSAPTLHQITSSLTSTGLPYPSTAFLTTHLTPLITAQPPRPLPALIATAKHRILSSNIVSSSHNTEANPPPLDASKNSSFPANITDVHKKEVKLGQDICVQVLDVEDLGKSKWEQIEALEAERKGEMTKGREVIRVVQDIDGPATQTSSANSANANTTATVTKSYGPFKLLLQDMRGQTVYGFELKRVDKVWTPAMGMSIGCKVMLKTGTKVARGMVLLEPKLTIVLGGKIEGLDKAWKDGREARLREEVKDANENGSGAG